MRKAMALGSVFALALLGCSISTGSSDSDVNAAWTAAVHACHLDNDDTITVDDDIHACDPGNTKKTTICHIPPGNPANAHTICVGNAAVPAHMHNHGDSIGACPSEPVCGTPDAGVVVETPDAEVVVEVPDAQVVVEI